MNQHEVEQAVRLWLDGESVNPATGAPPDAKLGITATRIFTFGETVEDGGHTTARDSWSVTAVLYFPEDPDEAPHAKVERVVERFEHATETAPGLPGGARVRWRGTGGDPHTRLDAPLAYPTAVEVLLTVEA